LLKGPEYVSARNRIRLGIGTLKEYGKIWPVGSQTLSEVKTIAREVFSMAALNSSTVDEMIVDLGGTESSGLLHIQSSLDDCGDFDYLALLDLPPQV
jgi:hypothetical protein